jgi:type IV pilus assembly protein PilV
MERSAFRPSRSLQKGAALIEALVSILIFTIGIVAIMGVQTVSMRTVSDSKMRMDAAHLAQKIIAEMWAVPRNTSSGQVDNAYLAATYASPSGAAYVRWRDNEVYAGATSLPKANQPGNAPTIVIDGSNAVTVSLFWQAPSDPTRRQYVMRTNIF